MRMARATSAQAALSSARAGSSYQTRPRSASSSAWRMARDPDATDAAGGPVQLVPEPAHEQGILADQELREATGIGLDRLRARAAEHQRVAEPFRTRIRVDAGDDEAMLGQVKRDRLDG